MTSATRLVTVAVATLVLGPSLAIGKVFDRCELARKLRAMGAPDDQISTWVCIAKHESSYDTGAVGPSNWDGSRDHGLFQINDRYWCSPSGTACGVDCNSLEDDDIHDDWRCAKRIFKAHRLQEGNGFKAWAVYQPHCSGDTSSYTAGCDEKIKNTVHYSYPAFTYGLPDPRFPWHGLFSFNNIRF